MSADTDRLTERETAWQNALLYWGKWNDAMNRARGGVGGGGYRDPHAGPEANHYREMLDELIAKHGFEGTRADPMLPWIKRQSASWQCPPDVEPARCIHGEDPTGQDRDCGCPDDVAWSKWADRNP